MLSRAQKTAIVEIVRDVAKAEILPRFRELGEHAISTKSGFDDLVTVADVAAEKAMTAKFNQAIPEAKVVGEEAVAADPNVLNLLDSNELVLIIDPIDGTWNYANGLSTFGVLIAASYLGETVYGLLYDAINDDWIEASKGEGAWYVKPGTGPRRLQIGDDVTDPNLVGIFSPFLFKDLGQRQKAGQLQTKYARVIALRCCCHEYRTLLNGNVDFFISPKPNAWDHAAGILAYQEAGGLVSMSDGTPYRPSVREGVIVVARNEATMSAIINDVNGLID